MHFQDNAPRACCVYLLVRSLALILGVALSTLAADSPSHEMLKQVERRYNRAQTLEVQFAENYTGPGRPSRTEAGTLYLRKPGRMRWEYSTPAGKLFISDGKSVYLYLPNSNRVEKMRLKETEDMRAPLAFLLGKLDFAKEFQNIETRPDPGGTMITAEAKSGNLPYSKVEFLVAATFEIRKLRVIGQDQSILDFTFESEKLNPPLANTMFQFKPPAGAEVIEGG